MSAFPASQAFKSTKREAMSYVFVRVTGDTQNVRVLTFNNDKLTYHWPLISETSSDDERLVVFSVFADAQHFARIIGKNFTALPMSIGACKEHKYFKGE